MKPSQSIILALLFPLAAVAQPRDQTSTGLPSGLVREGGVVMMQPIGESGGSAAALIFGGERRAPTVRALTAGDHDAFAQAVAAAVAGNWANARTWAAQARNPVIPRLIEWARVGQKNSGAPFAEIAQFLNSAPTWPGRDRIIARAEEAMTPGMEPQTVITWFAGRTPQTGIGKVRLGEALIATGAIPRGQEWIREAFIGSTFEPDQEDYIVAQHGNLLTEDVWRQRLDRLFARNELYAVRRDVPRLSPLLQSFAGARLQLRDYPALGRNQIAVLPPMLRDDPGVLWDEIALLRQENNVAAIPPLLARIPAAEVAQWNPSRWWSEINLDARAALKAGYSREAYDLAAAAALPRDADEYSDQQFLAGWIALRRLGEPRIALSHFQNLVPVATHPISKARAYYWAGRAWEAAGDLTSATTEYRTAATYPAMFYGQLALARIERSPLLHLVSTPADGDAVRATYEREEMTAAIRALADLGLEAALREFAVRDAESYPAAGHVKALAQDLVRMGYREVAVRVAKQASYNRIFLPEYSHPIVAVPRYTGPGTAPELALVHAIIRQETEFDPDAVSGAGARGIMQLMPDTAQRMARLSGYEYNFSALTTNPQYAMELGMAELSGALAEWGGSYVIASAAYNAGRGNARKWVAELGDPRNPLADPVDWIEQIPFGETRNYVQRVLENVQVYRNRLAGRDEPLAIMTDLYRPYAPPSSSVTSTSANMPAPTTTVTFNTPQTANTPAPTNMGIVGATPRPAASPVVSPGP